MRCFRVVCMFKNGEYKFGWQNRCHPYYRAVLTLIHVAIHKSYRNFIKSASRCNLAVR